MAQDGCSMENGHGNPEYLVVLSQVSRPETKHLKMPVKGELIFFVLKWVANVCNLRQNIAAEDR